MKRNIRLPNKFSSYAKTYLSVQVGLHFNINIFPNNITCTMNETMKLICFLDVVKHTTRDYNMLRAPERAIRANP